MAKDGTGRGGARPGAGRKPKALHDKILEGNPGKRPLTVLALKDTADLVGEDMPPPHEFLSAAQRDGKQTVAAEVYETTWRWVRDRRCEHLVPPQLVELYAQSVARWIQCEQAINAYGLLAKHPTTNNAIPSPYVNMGQNYYRQVANTWMQIYQTVKENSTTDYHGPTPHDDVMERLLTKNRERKR